MHKLRVLDPRIGEPGDVIDPPAGVNVRGWVKAGLAELAELVETPKRKTAKKATAKKESDS